MKKIIFFLAPACMLAASCHFGSRDSSGATPANVFSAIAENSKDVNKRVEELNKLTPISNDELKSFFPETVMGISRTSFDVNNGMGFAVGSAEYKKNDSTRFSVGISDCAGQSGAAFYSMSYMTKMNIEKEDENGYEKTTDFMGTKSLEEYHKSNKKYTESFVYADRFWVSIGAENGSLDDLKSFANGLNLDKLKDLK